MNERIRALAEQADAYSDAMDIGGKNYIGLRDEYFAELIVRECAEIVQEGRWMVPPSQYQLARSIKQHFGVEE